ncbi:unnamed protein product [Euphydryas editha]|nr:unnamed protein product [Euphydryas editha]
MGDLPSDRVTETRPIAGVGTDFACPFSVKTSTLRNSKTVKAYLCVFVCLSTKGVHLGLVSAFSTKAFVATLDRFVSRRGLPSLIRSDCGTNFKGTNNYLKEIYDFLASNETEIASRLASRRITWKFSLALCPHWGGIFESVLKVAKTHLRRVIGESILTFEELATVFCKIEAFLNSRPLFPLSSDPNDLEALTPGHFLIGQPLNALPEYSFVDQRVKWTDKTDPPHIGDLVLVKDANSPPLCWRRGRILNLVLGADGVPRLAEIQVDGSVLKRAVSSYRLHRLRR